MLFKNETEMQEYVSRRVTMWRKRVENMGYELEPMYHFTEVSKRMTRTAGYCQHRHVPFQKNVKCRYQFSYFFLVTATMEEVESTVMHEVCHSITGTTGHGKYWQECIRAIGNKWHVYTSTYYPEELYRRIQENVNLYRTDASTFYSRNFQKG